MAGSTLIADLTRAIGFGGIALNTVTQSGGAALVGCQITNFNPSRVEVRQFTEPLALAQGIEVGGVWYGARHVSMQGVLYDLTRGKAMDRLALLEAAMDPTAIFAASSTSYGFSALTWYVMTASGQQQRTLYVRPNGLQVSTSRDMFGGPDGAPLSIPWSVEMVAKNPVIA